MFEGGITSSSLRGRLPWRRGLRLWLPALRPWLPALRPWRRELRPWRRELPCRLRPERLLLPRPLPGLSRS